jgi:hypothetical protein
MGHPTSVTARTSFTDHQNTIQKIVTTLYHSNLTRRRQMIYTPRDVERTLFCMERDLTSTCKYSRVIDFTPIVSSISVVKRVTVEFVDCSVIERPAHHGQDFTGVQARDRSICSNMSCACEYVECVSTCSAPSQIVDPLRLRRAAHRCTGRLWQPVAALGTITQPRRISNPGGR